MPSKIATASVGWFERALFETSPTPRGNFRQAWTMKLMRSATRCRLPRGFGNVGPMFVGGHTTPSTHA